MILPTTTRLILTENVDLTIYVATQLMSSKSSWCTSLTAEVHLASQTLLQTSHEEWLLGNGYNLHHIVISHCHCYIN